MSELDSPACQVENAPPPFPTNDAELMRGFDSLGDNCEFGLVQRYAGCEPPGLFRFNFTHLPKLLEGIETSFAGLADPGQVSLAWHGEWVVQESRYGFAYHTYIGNPERDQAQLINTQSKWMRVMARRFLDELATGELIYVRKGEGAEAEAEIRTLCKVLRRHGPVTLLWVRLAEPGRPPGTVQWIDDGLMLGSIGKLASYEEAHRGSVPAWVALCRRAWSLRWHGNADAFPPRQSPHNNLPANFGGWTGVTTATADFVWDIPALEPEMEIMRHRLVDGHNGSEMVYGNIIRSRVAPGEFVCAIAWIWLPEDCPAVSVGIVMRGNATHHPVGCDMSLRDQWQPTWITVRTPIEHDAVFPALHAQGPAGTIFFSTGWRLERGTLPTSLLPTAPPPPAS